MVGGSTDDINSAMVAAGEMGRREAKRVVAEDHYRAGWEAAMESVRNAMAPYSSWDQKGKAASIATQRGPEEGP